MVRVCACDRCVGWGSIYGTGVCVCEHVVPVGMGMFLVHVVCVCVVCGVVFSVYVCIVCMGMCVYMWCVVARYVGGRGM